MNFTNKELAVLNYIISIALLSGEVEFNEISKEIHEKVTGEIRKRNTSQCTTKQ